MWIMQDLLKNLFLRPFQFYTFRYKVLVPVNYKPKSSIESLKLIEHKYNSGGHKNDAIFILYIFYLYIHNSTSNTMC